MSLSLVRKVPLVGDELWRRYFAGDHDALVDIVRHCHGDLLRRVRRCLSVRSADRFVPSIDALDVCQRIYLQLWSSRHLLPDRSVASIDAYLWRLAQNAIQSELRAMIAARRDARRVAGSYEKHEDRDKSTFVLPTFEGEIEQQEEISWYLSLAPQSDRELLVLVLAGLDWHDIATRLSLSHDTVRMRFKRLTLRLRMRDQGPHDRSLRATARSLPR